MSSGQVATSSVQVAMSTGKVGTASQKVGMSYRRVGTASWKVAMCTVTVVTGHAEKMTTDLSKHCCINHGVVGLAHVAAATKQLLCDWVIHMPCFFLIEIGGLAFGNLNSMVTIRSTPN